MDSNIRLISKSYARGRLEATPTGFPIPDEGPVDAARRSLDPESGGTYRLFRTTSAIEECDMPTYEFRCEKCGKKFSRVEPISQHGKKRPKCPKCSSVKVSQVFSSFFAKTGKKS
jgi:putative FmdB family regulatory protein